MATIRLDIEYDGSGFSGWARQPGLRTVQGELETALATVLGGADVDLIVAGRTDAGVHALGQVASFSLDSRPPADLARAVNSVGPDDVTVTAATIAADGFDARRDATSRSYLYRVLAARTPSPFERGRALWWPHPLERSALDACASALVGSHDFTAFTPTQTDHVRFDRQIFRAEWLWGQAHIPARGGGGLSISDSPGPHRSQEMGVLMITADAFMRNMVRVLVGTMLDVASGRRTLAEFETLLKGAPRPAAGDTAPPHGLYLESVSYE
ncbi:MAG TPA: tRNA pseudouridine(38-40) synthase TruA [Solirubrobacterales bacterium]